MRFRKRDIPRFNSTSMADMAFLLLIFFLVTSSLESRTGIYRRLSPDSAGEILRKKSEIEERNLLSFRIDGENNLWMGDEPLQLAEIRELAATFIANPDDLDFLPEREIREIPLIGAFPVTLRHVIQLQTSRKATYQTYISVLNELTAAYNGLREELSLKSFGKPFLRLNEEERKAVLEAYPQRLSEKESETEESKREGGDS